jgi:hypothetical protein
VRRRRSSTEPVDSPVETREDGPDLLRDVGDPQPSGRRNRSAKRSVDELNEAVRQHEHLYEEHRHELEELERSLIERQE